MIKCPNADCGYENVDGTQFCEMCGEELSAATSSGAPAVAASAGATTGAAEVKCPACDNMNPAENLVCEVCGTELRPGAIDAAPVQGAAPDVGIAPPPPVATFPVSVPPMDAPVTPPSQTTPFDASIQTPPDSATPATPPMPPAPVDAATDAAVSTGTDATLPDVSVSTASPTDSITDPIGIAPPPPTTPAIDAPVADPNATATAAAPVASGNLQPGAVRLTVEQGMSVGKQFVLGDAEIQVGREDDEDGIYPDIDLSDQDEGYVHRRHATLRFDNGTLTVEHLGGANKTRINNRPLPDNTPQPVNVGDKIAFGKVVVRVGTNP